MRMVHGFSSQVDSCIFMQILDRHLPRLMVKLKINRENLNQQPLQKVFLDSVIAASRVFVGVSHIA